MKDTTLAEKIVHEIFGGNIEHHSWKKYYTSEISKAQSVIDQWERERLKENAKKIDKMLAGSELMRRINEGASHNNPPQSVSQNYELWKYLHDQHGLILLESELNEIILMASNQKEDKDLEAEAREFINNYVVGKDDWLEKNIIVISKLMVQFAQQVKTE